MGIAEKNVKSGHPSACEVRLQPLFKKKERRWQALGRGSNLAPMPQPKKRWIRYVFVHPFDVPLPPHFIS